MARKQSIDRSALLSAAEDIVVEQGAAALTISSLADAIGISKGGVQSCFASKELLILALLDRWIQEEDERFKSELKDGTNLTARILAHARVTRDGGIGNTRSASLLIALLQSPQNLGIVREWYQRRLAGLSREYASNPQLLLAFLATEGAYYLRYFGLFDLSAPMWKQSFANIESLLEDGARKGR